MKGLIITLLGLGLSSLLSGCETHAEKSIKTICRAAGNDSSFCSCVYDKVEDRYSSSDLEKMYEGKEAPPNDFDSFNSRAMLECHEENRE